jgi:hypothetical protein
VAIPPRSSGARKSASASVNRADLVRLAAGLHGKIEGQHAIDFCQR